METQMENSEIKTGDIVRLVQPFRVRAERYSFREYAFGIVVGVVRNDSISSKIPQSRWEFIQAAQTHQSGFEQLVVYLYEPDSSTTYMDQFGVKALFSFDSNEVALYKPIQTPACK
jgi:hypothetical protein